MSQQEAAEDSQEDSTDPHTLYLKRCRNLLVDYYAQDEKVLIYGLFFTKADSSGDLWDVAEAIETDGEETEYRYIDTVNVSKFVTAVDLRNHVLSYFPDEDPDPDPEEIEETEDDADPTRAFN